MGTIYRKHADPGENLTQGKSRAHVLGGKQGGAWLPTMRLTVIVVVISLCALISLHAQAFKWQSTPKNLQQVAAAIAGNLAADWVKSGRGKGKKPFVHISRNYFADPHSGANYPFSSSLVAELRHALTDTGMFDVRARFDADHDLMITGEYYREQGRLIILVRLQDFQAEDGSLASARLELEQKYWAESWFVEDVRGKMFFLLQKLEKKYFRDVGKRIIAGSRMDVLVEKFKYQNTKLYSPFSDYASQYIPDFLTQSHFLTPKAALAKDLMQASKSRNIVPVASASKEGTVAAVSGAAAVFSGSYWQIGHDQLEIKASLTTSSGDIAASDTMRIPTSLVAPQLLRLPQAEDKPFVQDLALPIVADPGFNVTLMTDRGRNNISYRRNQSMIFYVKVNRPAYLYLFNRGADGSVYQIYPNAFTSRIGQVQPNELVAIPGDNDAGFEFKVHDPLGNELVKAYAADKPLPKLPGQDIGFGFKKIDADLQAIQQRYTKYATGRGIRLADDVLAIVTQP